MDILLLKNTGSSALEIADMGVYLEANEEIDLLLNYRNEDIIESTDVESAMSGDVTVALNQGSGPITLSYTDLVQYLTSLTRYDKIDFAYISGKDDDTDVTGAESAVHWDNITNAPQFGALNWKDPVDRSDSSYGSGTVLPLTGNELHDARMVADDGDGKPAQYVCIAQSGTWSEQWIKIADVDWGSANSISVTSSGNLAATNVQSALYELQGDIDTINTTIDGINMDYTYNNGSVVTVDTTDVDFKLASTKSFIVSSDTTQSLKVTGTTTQINGALDVNGGAITLDANTASRLAVTGNNLTLSTITSGNVIISSAGNVTFKDQFLTSSIALSESGTTGLDARFTKTSIIGAINETLDIASGNNTLDDAYDGATENGAGREIIVDSGSVKLDATSATYAPLELTPQTAAPTSGLAGGQIAFIGDHLYQYDGTRAKWLSIDEQHFDWGENSASGKYLKIGSAIGTEVGYKIPMDATITMITARATSGNLSKSIQLRKNGSSTSIKSFSLSSGEYTSNNDNINLSAGDYIQVYVEAGSTPVKDIVISIYTRWRK